MTDRRPHEIDRHVAGPAGEHAPDRGTENFESLLHRFDPKRDDARGERVPELVLLGADDIAALSAVCRRFAEQAIDGEAFSDIARVSRRAFDAGAPVRLAVVANDDADLAAKLGHAVDGFGVSGSEPYSGGPGVYVGSGTWTGTVAFLFPGQGSHYIGMGADLAMSFSAAHAAWERAAGLALDGDIRLGDIVFPPPAKPRKPIAKTSFTG